MKKPAIFMDRDGTINEQMGYINHLSRFRLFPGVTEAVRLLNTNDFLAIVVSNQSGVARGYFPMSLVEKVHSLLKESLGNAGAFLDEILFCPHYPTGIVSEYALECDCRKPKTGLIDRAQHLFDIDMSGSFIIGDHSTDMALARNCGLKGIMVKTGYGMGEVEYTLPQMSFKPCYVANDLLDAVKWIIKK